MGSNGLCTTPCATTCHVPKNNWSCWAEWATRLESAIMNTSPTVCKRVSSTSAPVQLHSQLYSWTPGNRPNNLDHEREMCRSLHHYLLSKRSWLTYLTLDGSQCLATPITQAVAAIAHLCSRWRTAQKNSKCMNSMTQANCSSTSPGKVPLGDEHAWQDPGRDQKQALMAKTDTQKPLKVLPGPLKTDQD